MISKNNKKIQICLEKLQRSGGFTLIELLVSMAIFSICLVMILGATISIVDANKKARTLMTVMNNLNFAVDSMTRSFSTGKDPNMPPNCFHTTEINYGETSESLNIEERGVSYCFIVDANGLGKISKLIPGHQFDLTSPDIDIDFASFEVSGSQPKLLINLEGTAKVGGKISSNFSIQTTVSQKKLNFN